MSQAEAAEEQYECDVLVAGSGAAALSAAVVGVAGVPGAQSPKASTKIATSRDPGVLFWMSALVLPESHPPHPSGRAIWLTATGEPMHPSFDRVLDRIQAETGALLSEGGDIRLIGPILLNLAVVHAAVSGIDGVRLPCLAAKIACATLARSASTMPGSAESAAPSAVMVTGTILSL